MVQDKDKDKFIDELEMRLFDKQFNEVEQLISNKFGYNIKMLKAHTQSQRVVYVRMIFSYLCVERQIPINIIGRKLEKSRTSISIYLKNIEPYCKSDKLFKVLFDVIKEK